MQARTKLILIITGSVLVAGGLAVGLYFILRKPKEDDTNDTSYKTKDTNKDNPASEATFSNNSSSNTSSTSNEIKPTFNAEGELSNGFSEIKGRVLYPKRIETGGWGYTNVRTSAEVNTDQGWWDPSDNLIATINSGTSIGTVISETTGLFNGYSYRWFKVKLTKSVGGFWSSYSQGFVRADTVTFQSYKP